MDFELSGWMLILCTVLAGLYTFLLYGRRDSQWRPSMRIALASLRFASSFLISFLILGPFLSFRSLEKQKPILAIGVDHSSSIRSSEGVIPLETIKQQAAALREALDDQFDTYLFNFGESTRLSDESSFDDQQSNYTDFLKTIDQELGSDYLKGIVLLGDGLHNSGASPLYHHSRYPVAIHTIGVGDTTRMADWQIAEAVYNQVAFLGNTYPIEVNVKGEELDAASNYTLELLDRNGSLLQSQQGTTNSVLHNQKHVFELSAEMDGYQEFILRIRSDFDEVKLKNNTQTIGINVIDASVKILITYNAPHPDIRAIKDALATKKIYSISAQPVSLLNDDIIRQHSLIITHNLATSPRGLQTLSRIYELNRNALHIVGSSVPPAIWNRANGVIPIQGQNARSNEVRPRLNDDFTRFILDPATKQWLNQLPPLSAPFGQYNDRGDYPLLYQRVGSVNTDYPLITFTEGQVKQGYIFGEGIYKWRIYTYQRDENHELFDNLLTSSIQYLSTKEDNRRLKVRIPAVIDSRDELLVRAEVYNSAMQLDYNRQVEISLTDSNAQTTKYRLNLIGDSYQKNLSDLAAGRYQVEVTTDDDEVNRFTSELNVRPSMLESSEDRANHDLLRTLSSQTGGMFVYFDSIEELKEKLTELDVKSISFEDFIEVKLIDFVWLLVLIALLLSTEWFLRKRG